MKLLLDTHVLLWFFEGNSALSPAARSAMESSDNECYVSHATAWEIAIKISLGKLRLQIPYDTLFPDALSANGFLILPSEVRHFRELIELPFHHRDPFDRLLLAQAKCEGMALVTADANLASYAVPIVW